MSQYLKVKVGPSISTPPHNVSYAFKVFFNITFTFFMQGDYLR